MTASPISASYLIALPKVSTTHTTRKPWPFRPQLEGGAGTEIALGPRFTGVAPWAPKYTVALTVVGIKKFVSLQWSGKDWRKSGSKLVLQTQAALSMTRVGLVGSCEQVSPLGHTTLISNSLRGRKPSSLVFTVPVWNLGKTKKLPGSWESLNIPDAWPHAGAGAATPRASRVEVKATIHRTVRVLIAAASV